MTGTLSSQVRVNPGDWIFGDMDGVLVIPESILPEVLDRAEEAREIEGKTRAEVQAGVPVSEVYKKYGRL
jgi:regulator of RNase E activity RraA